MEESDRQRHNPITTVGSSQPGGALVLVRALCLHLVAEQPGRVCVCLFRGCESTNNIHGATNDGGARAIIVKTVAQQRGLSSRIVDLGPCVGVRPVEVQVVEHVFFAIPPPPH